MTAICKHGVLRDDCANCCRHDEYPTQEQFAQDTVASALHALTIGNPPFDQILWDAHRHALSFRRSGIDDYINLWLHREGGEHLCERNGQPPLDATVLWQDGEWVEEDGRRKFRFSVPPDMAEEEVDGDA